MSSVVSRTFRSTPHRTGADTWAAIVSLLTRGQSSEKSKELNSVGGIASSVIVDHAAKDAPIVVTCSGPRTRIYCIYDDDALDESAANESPLGFDPLEGDWHVSLPCNSDDLAWVQRALKERGSRVTARDASEGFVVTESANAATASPHQINMQELFK
jgi:hypothetical protein